MLLILDERSNYFISQHIQNMFSFDIFFWLPATIQIFYIWSPTPSYAHHYHLKYFSAAAEINSISPRAIRAGTQTHTQIARKYRVSDKISAASAPGGQMSCLSADYVVPRNLHVFCAGGISSWISQTKLDDELSPLLSLYYV